MSHLILSRAGGALKLAFVATLVMSLVCSLSLSQSQAGMLVQGDAVSYEAIRSATR